MPRSTLALNAAEQTALERLRQTAAQPYLRERAAAILKVAAGQSVTQVAHEGLLRPRKIETVCRWLARYRTEGVAGLTIRSGRGRKPAFFPSGARRRAPRAAGPDPTGAASVRP